MREILFRGKSRTTGKWFQGDLVTIAHKRFIDDDIDRERVNPATVGQYTGITDKNGKKIFEGDIVKADDYIFEVKFGKCGGVANAEDFGYMGFYLEPYSESTKLSAKYGLRNDICYFTNIDVIGNIHDNPELLKGAESNG